VHLAHALDFSALIRNQVFEFDHDRDQGLPLHFREVRSLQILDAEPTQLFKVFNLQATCHEHV